jgi:uroporphyrin-III C-methyltransferase
MTRPVQPGRVHLVGAGPGDPELLTLRAAAVLAAADVVFHDQLVTEEVLALVRAGAERVNVGHRAGAGRRDLVEVAERMAGATRRGLVVVRLKGGDPFVFGRGSEELLELLALGVPFEVVPGISAALAGPVAAGIPLTHRGLATSVVIVTGHERDPARAPRWERLRGDTVVVLMGAGRLDGLGRQMLEAGWDPGTPAAVVMEATRPGQRQVTGCLRDVAERAARAGLGSPSILVVGAVAALAGELRPGSVAGAGAGR